VNGPLLAVTGATGFVGRHLVAGLGRGWRVRALVRAPLRIEGTESIVIGDLRAPRDLDRALHGVDVVVHAAAMAHGAGRTDQEMDEVNHRATVRLAERARAAGVRRFVFLSSVRAQTGPYAAVPLDEAMPPAPADSYGRAKLAAEHGLDGVGLDWVALRPVIVYGDGVGANMGALFRLARSPWPLPFGAIHARRSLLAVENLVDAVDVVAKAPGPMRRPFLVADTDPLDLGQMIRAIREGYDRAPGLVSVPRPFLALGFGLLGNSEAWARLDQPLVVVTDRLRALGWAPRIASDAGLTALARRVRAGASLPTEAPRRCGR
jgi:nucleoside-diphosphate-sugar epimerase